MRGGVRHAGAGMVMSGSLWKVTGVKEVKFLLRLAWRGAVQPGSAALWHSAASPQTRRCKTVVFWGFCPWQGRRQKPIVCPTLAQRDEEVFMTIVARPPRKKTFLSAWFG